jgi:ribosome modulation factor
MAPGFTESMARSTFKRMNPAPTALVAAASHRGREAFLGGQSPDSCPFEPGSPDARTWMDAYVAAREFREWLDGHLEREA